MGGTARVTPSARFDDLTGAKGSFRFHRYAGEVVARNTDDVAGAIAQVEAATGNGHWAAGFVSYEAAPGLDAALAVRPASDPSERPPLVWFALFKDRMPVAAPGRVSDDPNDAGRRHDWSPAGDADSYREQVQRVRSHIAAGDTYQLNLTQPWRSTSVGDPTELYNRLLLAQRPAYGALIDTGRWVVASASPELFFHWRHGVVTCRPMKGTAARGRWVEEDRAAGAALAASAKDRAENVMIVDLVRNDLGRVAVYGSIAVADLFHLERYPTVWQLTSEVSARTRPGCSLLDLFRGLFPCGSVTGAPKRRTMELITDIENQPRGLYCGAVGFVGPEEARFSVAIRTVVIDSATGEATYGTGGGIVWDSDPGREYAEAKAKTEILFLASPPFDLIETMAFTPAEGLRNRDRHLERLAGSAEYFGYPLCRDAISTLLDRTIEALRAPALLRLSLTESGHTSVETAPLPISPTDAVRLAIDDDPVRSSDVWLYHKTSRRDPYMRRRARHPEVDDVILVNELGQVTETTVANLAVFLDGRWWTPPLDCGCLPGVERGRLLGLDILAERPITSVELSAGAGIALVSSVRGWRPGILVPGGPQRA
jgi:para-aminobenzoate synthetase / 4-amino-4-deoxychorismate lyase